MLSSTFISSNPVLLNQSDNLEYYLELESYTDLFKKATLLIPELAEGRSIHGLK